MKKCNVDNDEIKTGYFYQNRKQKTNYKNVS